MAFDFTNLIRPERREAFRRRLDAERREMARLYALPDRWLAQELLRLAREIRANVPGLARPDGQGSGYNSFALWQLVPEIARRLGAPLGPHEATDYDLKTASPKELRRAAGYAFNWIDRDYLKPAKKDEADLCPVGVLFHGIANGSPIAMALDRIAPPGPEADDYVARHVREISRARGHEVVSSWHPGLQDMPEPAADMDGAAFSF